MSEPHYFLMHATLQEVLPSQVSKNYSISVVDQLPTGEPQPQYVLESEQRPNSDSFLLDKHKGFKPNDCKESDKLEPARSELQRKILFDECYGNFRPPSILRRHFRGPHQKSSEVPGTALNETTVKAVEKFPNAKDYVREGEKQNYCTQCDKGFVYPSQYRRHFNNVHLKLFQVACPICGGKVDKDSLPAHLKTHVKNLEKLLSENINEHLLFEVKEQPDLNTPELVVVNLPSSEPQPDTMLEVGQRQHQHICETCGKLFRTAGLLRSHVNYTHLRKYIVSCPKCGIVLCNPSGLRRHLKGVHGEIYETKRSNILVDRKTFCDVCERNFRKPSNYRRHLLTHQHKSQVGSLEKRSVVVEGKQYCCPTCGKCYKNRSSCRTHQLIVHLKKGRAACPVCFKVLQKQNMKKHLRRAHGDRSEPPKIVRIGYHKNYCKDCDKSYKTRTTYRRHVILVHMKEGQGVGRHAKVNMRTVLNPKLHACQECGRTFIRKRKLTYHMKQHELDDWEYCSPFDDFKSTDFAAVVDHLSSSEPQPDTVLECDLCHEILWAKDYLLHYQRHMLTDEKFACQLVVNCRACNLCFPTEKSAILHEKICDRGMQKDSGKSWPIYPCCSCRVHSKEKRILRVHNEKFHEKNVAEVIPLNWERLLAARENGSLDLDYECYLCERPLRSRHTAVLHVRDCEGNYFP